MIRYDKERPWLSEDGSPISTEDLKKVCKKWGASIWEQYLQAYEPIIEEDENLDFKDDIDSLIQDASSKQTFSELFELKDYESLKWFIDRCMTKKLSRKQATVLKQYYWEGQTMRQVAEALNLPVTTVHRLFHEALTIIKLSCENALAVAKAKK